jgi:hypothetical protein
MDKGVIDPAISGVPGTADPADRGESARSSGSGLHRRRRRKHHRLQNLNKRSGKGVEIAVVTLIAIGILFAVIFSLIERYQHRPNDDSSGRLSPSPGHGLSAASAVV